MTDTLLAILHHLLVFGLFLTIAGEVALTRPGLDAEDLARLGRLDAGYGVSAGLVVAIGLLRVFLGAMGADYYLANPWFWAKMAAFAAVGLLSIPPTVAIIRWRRALKADTTALPDPAAVRGVRNLLRLELGLLLLIPVFAALMARYQG